MRLMLASIAVVLAGCQSIDLSKPVCITAHSPSVETSDGVKMPSRTTRVCSAYIEIERQP